MLNHAQPISQSQQFEMGNTESQQLTTSSTLDHFSKRFIILPHSLDPEQTFMFYLHEKLTDNKYILRVLTTNDLEERQRTEALVCKKLAIKKSFENKPIRVTPIDHYIIDQQKGYCNLLNKCFILFDIKRASTLAYFLEKAAFNPNLKAQLTEQSIYEWLLQLVEGVALLSYYKDPHRNINCETVYFSPEENTFTLADPWISPLNQLHEQYHSPQKLKQMRNQIDNHDPYLSDLFSVGIVGLRILGVPTKDLYSFNKTINFQNIDRVIDSIRNRKLKDLLSRLLSFNTNTRETVLSEVRIQTPSYNLHVGQNGMMKTRNLTGKVASVRKSFVGHQNQVAQFTRITPNPQNYVSNNAQMRIQDQFHPNEHPITIGGDFRKKEIINNFNLKPLKQEIRKQSKFQKPEIDIGPIFKNNNQIVYNSFHHNIHQNIYVPPPIVLHPPHHVTQPIVTPYSPLSLFTKPNLPSTDYNNASSHSLLISNSETHLRNHVPLTTNMNLNKKQLNSGSAPSLFNHSGLTITQSKIEQKNIQVSNVVPLQGKQLLMKPNEASQLTQFHKSNYLSPTSVNVKKEQMKTSPNYRSQSSFENDHLIRNKIQQNLKQLESRISEAISSSRLNVTDNSQASAYVNLQNSHHKMIESVIIPPDCAKQQTSSPTVVGSEDIIKQGRSPILVKEQSAQKPQKQESPKQQQPKPSEQSEQSNSNSNNNINKQLEAQSQPEQTKNKKYDQQFRFEQFLRQKAQSVARLQANNLTIPEQSDEESVEGEQRKIKGDYVEEVYENGGKYQGYMLNGQRNGPGTFYYRDGGYYEGKWKNNMMSGFGKLYYQTKKLAYEGQWYQDQFHGRGIVYNDQPETVPQEGFDYQNMNESENYWQYYEGDLSHDMKARWGKLVLSNGEYYQGEFKNDQVHGKGQFHKIDGTCVKGLWAQGKFVKEL